MGARTRPLFWHFSVRLSQRAAAGSEETWLEEQSRGRSVFLQGHEFKEASGHRTLCQRDSFPLFQQLYRLRPAGYRLLGTQKVACAAVKVEEEEEAYQSSVPESTSRICVLIYLWKGLEQYWHTHARTHARTHAISSLRMAEMSESLRLPERQRCRLQDAQNSRQLTRQLARQHRSLGIAERCQEAAGICTRGLSATPPW